MKKIYIFGVGKGKEIVKENLIEDNIELLGYIDNNAKAYTEGIDNKKVILLEEIEEDFDYIIVSVMRYKHINEQLFDVGISKDKVIDFFSFNDSVKEEYWCVLHKYYWRMEAISFEFEKKIIPYNQNLIYELSDTRNVSDIKYPKILSADEAVEQICKEKKSLARFGDGEFALMRMIERPKFQAVNKELAERLKEVIRSKRKEILIAIADCYGSLEQYTLEAAEDIRTYMSPQVRQKHLEFLDLDKTYYDAYLSRPYIIYKDKENAGKRFDALKQIWEDRDVLIVEGDRTRMGIGNDLFDNAASIKRILAPNENAYDKYNEILECVKKNAENKLVLIALGPTATVLAYDLALLGVWAVDIGHIDIEYEWYRAGEKEKRDISYKYVNEINNGNHVIELPEELKKGYETEIIFNIS